MAEKEKKVRSIDSPSATGFQGGIVATDFTTVPPAPASIPAPFDLTGTSSVLFSAVQPSVGVALTWTPGGSSNPQSYTLQYSTSALFPDNDRVTEIAATSSALIDGLLANITYYFRVAANYRAIMSPFSETFSILTVSDVTPPDPIAQSSMTWQWPVADLRIAWTNPTNGNFRDVRVEIWDSPSKTVKYVDTFSSTGSYVFSAAQNFSVTSGNPDPSVYVELTSRSWGGVYATATTFGPASSPTTQPNKPKPATPTGLAADFTSRDAIFTWIASSGAIDYILTIDGVDYISDDIRFVYTFIQNKVQHSGTPDPSLTYVLKARDGLLQLSDPTSSATATNTPPNAITDLISTWDGDIGTADEDILVTWNAYTIPADLEYFEVTVSRSDNSGATIYRAQERRFDFPFSENKRVFSTPIATVKVSIRVLDAFAQASSAYVESFVNAAPPFATIGIFAGFTTVYAQVTNTGLIRDFDHYVYTIRSGGTSGAADGTLVSTFTDIIDNPVLSIDAIGNYKIGVSVYDMFNQTRGEIISDLVFIDALTIEMLRAEGQYSDSISTDFTSDPTGIANNTLLKDAAVGAGITYSSTTGTFGKTGIGGSTQDLAIDQKRANRWNAASAVVVSKLTAYVSGSGAGSGSQVMRGFIYSDSSNSPNALLGVTNEVTVTDGQAAGWIDLTFPTGIVLASGNYWIGLHGGANTNTIRIYRDSSSSAGRTATDTYSDGTAATFGSTSTVSQDYSVYASYTVITWRWTQFERPIQKMYRRLTVKTASGDPAIHFATGVLDSSGTIEWRYWAGVAGNGYSMTEYASLALAQAAAVSASAYIYGWAEIPVEVEARYVRLYHSGGFRLDEYYPRSMIRSDDIEAESIRAINIAAGAIVADKIAAGAVTAVKLSVGIGGGNLVKDGGFLVDADNNGIADAWSLITSSGTATVSFDSTPMVGYKGQIVTNTHGTDQLFGILQTISQGIRVGANYTISFFMATNTGLNSGCIVQFLWMDAASTVLSTTVSNTFFNSVANLYEKFSSTQTAPVSATQVQIRILANGGTSQRAYFAGVQLEEGDVATTWKPGYRGNVQIDGDGILVGVYNGARTTLTAGGLIGFNSSNVEQVRVDSTDGKVKAGLVILDSSGISIQLSSLSSPGVNGQYKFYRGAVLVSAWKNYLPSGNDYTTALEAYPLTNGTTETTTLLLQSVSTTNNQPVTAILSATGKDSVSSQIASVSCLYDGTDTSILLSAKETSITGVTLQINTLAAAIGTAPIINHTLILDGPDTGSSTYGLVVRNNAGTNRMYIRDDGLAFVSAASWTYGSDERKKENIQPIVFDWHDFMRIQPISFDYIQGQKNQRGYSAQNIQGIYAPLVEEDKDGMLSLLINGLLPYHTLAVQDLQKRVSQLEGMIT